METTACQLYAKVVDIRANHAWCVLNNYHNIVNNLRVDSEQWITSVVIRELQ